MRTDFDQIPIAVGRYEATVGAPRALADALRPMLIDLIRPSGWPRGAAILVQPGDDQVQITVDGRRWEPGPDQTVCDQLIYVLLRATLDAEPDLLHLHAAHVAMAGRGVLVAGPPGSGKSTLVARLVGAGFDYLTDERVGVDHAGALTALPKPVSLVSGAFEQLAHLDPRRTGAGAASHRLWHVPASAIRPGCVVADASPVALAFVEFSPGAHTSIAEVHPAEAVRSLLADSVDAVRYGPASVTIAARLCTSLRCVQVRFGEDDDVIAAFEELVRAPAPPQGDSVQALRSPAGGGGRERGEAVLANISARAAPRMADDVSGAVVGGRAVLYRGGTGQIIELDEAATAWLQLLDGRTTVEELADEIADANGVPRAKVLDMAIGVVRRLVRLQVVE